MMIGSRHICFLLLLLSTALFCVSANDGDVGGETTGDLLGTSIEILKYTESLDGMLDKLETADSTGVASLRSELWKIDLKWKLYYANVESLVATDDDLMSSVLLYNNKNKQVNEGIESRSKELESKKSFDAEFANLQRGVGEYQKMKGDAVGYSLSEKLADKLSALKANEEILFGQMQSSYATIGSVCSEFGDVPQKVVADSMYSQILVYSQQVKSTEYQSFFDRAKDYLYGLAAVVMVLMFINMVQTKISAAKKLKESTKAMEKLMKGGDSEYPTI